MDNLTFEWLQRLEASIVMIKARLDALTGDGLEWEIKESEFLEILKKNMINPGKERRNTK